MPARISTGNLQLDRHRLEMAPLVRETMSLLEPAANAKHIRVETDIDARAMMVDGDATRLRQVVWNLRPRNSDARGSIDWHRHEHLCARYWTGHRARISAARL
jgi:C4-dicarboxylate-specific signal transduction histidine kinase